MDEKMKAKARGFLLEAEQRIPGLQLNLEDHLAGATRDGVNVGVVLAVGEIHTGHEWFPKPTGKLKVGVRRRHSTIKTFRERKDGTYNWDGIVAEVERVIELEVRRIMKERDVASVRRVALDALKEHGASGGYTFTVGPNTKVPTVSVNFVITPEQIEQVIELLDELGVPYK